MRYRHTGSALLTALALLITAASIVTLLITIQRVSIRRTETLQAVEQLYDSALGVEQWALVQLQTWQKEKKLFQTWPVRMPPMTLQGVQIRGEITDWQGKFNLQNLKITTAKQEHSKALQTILIEKWSPLSADQARALADVIATPVRSFLPPKMPSELRLLEEVTAQRYQTLLPEIAILTANTKINLNSVTPLILRAYLPELKEADAQAFVAYREQNKGLQKVDDIKDLFPDLQYSDTLFSTTSEYYLITSIATQKEDQLTLYTLMRITEADTDAKSKVHILWRSWNTL